ncbi:MAG: hypothetical protein ACMUJM_14590 [bacterium]
MNEKHQSKVFIACEGLLTKDSTLEALCRYFIPDGDILFKQIIHYCLLNSMSHSHSHKSEDDPAKYIIPFLKGYGADNEKVAEYCAFNIHLVPGADKFLQWLKDRAFTFIMSKGYAHNTHALCELVGFKEENTHSVSVDFNHYHPTISEKETIRDMAAEIIQLPFLMPEGYEGTLEELSVAMRHTLDKIQFILCEQIPKMPIGWYLNEVEPLGNQARAQCVREQTHDNPTDLSHIIYFGERSSDKDAMRLVKEGGGLTVAFNGDREALMHAEIACMAVNADILTILCDHFFQEGKKGVVELAEDWGPYKLDNLETDTLLAENLQTFDIHLFPRLKRVSDTNIEALAKQSTQWRNLI